MSLKFQNNIRNYIISCNLSSFFFDRGLLQILPEGAYIFLVVNTFHFPASKKMSEDSDVGRAIIRREIMRFITNLSSSVGTKGSEQGLLQ